MERMCKILEKDKLKDKVISKSPFPKYGDVVFIVMWLFYVFEVISGYILGGDWVWISMVGVIFIPIGYFFKKMDGKKSKE